LALRAVSTSLGNASDPLETRKPKKVEARQSEEILGAIESVKKSVRDVNSIPVSLGKIIFAAAARIVAIGRDAAPSGSQTSAAQRRLCSNGTASQPRK
jgi:hypothetical protein